ncbi:hypothetical protein [Thauera butanivorans]|uniref:hypothetical protein n=1 Tax=Thauera butanivorans TaxID=86174 RepID=UPI001FE0D137|nr:hypothetical protein [Thauera butanivorans]
MKYTFGRSTRSLPAKCISRGSVRRNDGPEDDGKLLAMSPEERSRRRRCVPSNAKKGADGNAIANFDTPVQPLGWILTRYSHLQDQMFRPGSPMTGPLAGTREYRPADPSQPD